MKTTIRGREFEVAPEPADFWGWVREGRYDFEWKALDGYLKPEHTFVDLGAWVGSHSLYASTIATRVIAVEPDPVANAILRQNVRGRGIEVLESAVAHVTGKVRLGSGWLGASTTRMNLAAGGGIGPAVEDQIITASCTTLRALCQPFPDPLFIKMDIEGAEQYALDIEFFRARKPVLFLETHPFWWHSIEETWERIRAIRALYGEALDLRLNPIDRDSRPQHCLFL